MPKRQARRDYALFLSWLAKVGEIKRAAELSGMTEQAVHARKRSPLHQDFRDRVIATLTEYRRAALSS